MLIIYVSGPMTNIRDYNRSAFAAAAEQLVDYGYECRNPAVIGSPEDSGNSHPYEWYLKRALAMMLEADAVAVLPGWFNSRGATVEVDLATTLKMPVMTVDMWLSRTLATPEGIASIGGGVRAPAGSLAAGRGL